MGRPIALITGGSRGIGRAIAIQLARDGFRVVINYHTNQEAAESVREIIASEGGQGVIRQFDVANQHAVEAAVKGMLPRNRLGNKMLTKLKVYAGPQHPHQAQRPEPYEISQIAQ